jgi:hypothetical protein
MGWSIAVAPDGEQLHDVELYWSGRPVGVGPRTDARTDGRTGARPGGHRQEDVAWLDDQTAPWNTM